VIATVALGGLIGATTAIVQTQVSGARGMRAIGRAAAHGEAADQWMDHASAVACTTTTPRHRHRADCWGRTGQAASTTTTAPTATTPPSTAPASTAAPITTPPTTAAPTTAPRSCAPIRITAGGTYSGCYASTSTGTPAVTLATSQPVTLDHARVVAKGFGVQDTVTGTRLTVVDATFEQTDPGAVVAHRAIELQQPASFVAEHNRFTDGDGIWIGGGRVDPLTVRYNQAIDIGRYPHPTSSNCCVQFLQLDSVTAPAGEIAWNHTQNTSGRSGVEDNINHTSVHDNTVVSTTNYGVGAAGGTDVHLANNLLVNDTLGSDGSTHYYSEFAQAISIHDLTASEATNNSFNWRRDSSTSQFPCWIGTFCSGARQVSTTEQQARDAWTASVPAGARPIGPRP